MGTAQEGVTVLTTQPVCGAPHGKSGRASQLKNHGGDVAFWRSRAVFACGADDADLTNDGFAILDISDPTHP